MLAGLFLQRLVQRHLVSAIVTLSPLLVVTKPYLLAITVLLTVPNLCVIPSLNRISTATGSTAAMAAAGGDYMDIRSRK